MASGLRERARLARKEGSSDSRTEDIEQIGGIFVQAGSLEERSPSHIRTTRGSFGHPDGFVRRLRFGNPGGMGNSTPTTVKSLGELIGLDMVDVQIHAAMGWIMSGLLGPGRELVTDTPPSGLIDGRGDRVTPGGAQS